LQAGYTWGKSLDDVSGINRREQTTGAVTLLVGKTRSITRAEEGRQL